jgi:GntR family transcriptional regulator
VTRSLADETLAAHEPLRIQLLSWLEQARQAGLGPAAIEALFLTTFRETQHDIQESRKFTEVNP